MELCVILFVMILSGFYILFSAIFAAKQALQPNWEKKIWGRTCADGIPVGTGLASVPNGQACADGNTVGTGAPQETLSGRPGDATYTPVPTVLPSAQLLWRARPRGTHRAYADGICADGHFFTVGTPYADGEKLCRRAKMLCLRAPTPTALCRR